MARHKVTQKDIAEKCGVSVALVSYVLNGKEHQGRVSAAMAAKIKSVAEELGYRPNYAARSLRGKSQMNIGCIVADISNPFFASIARHVEDECYRRGYTVIFGSSDEDSNKFNDLLDVMLNRQVDGLLLSPTNGTYNRIKELKDYEVPFVLFDRYFDEPDIHYVGIDNFRASYEAVNYLTAKGYRRVAMLSHESSLLHFQKREDGWRAALTDLGLSDIDHLLCRVRHHEKQRPIGEAIQLLLENQQLQAIYFGSNMLAHEGLSYLFQAGIRIPEDLEVVAFDDHVVYDFFHHPIVHVCQPLEEMAVQAVCTLLDIIENQTEAVHQQLLPAKLKFGHETRTRTTVL